MQPKWGNLEYEIAAALAFTKCYIEEAPGNYFIYFVPKEKYIYYGFMRPTELREVGSFLKKVIKTDTLTDVSLIRLEKGGGVGVVPLQIKRFGIGDSENGNDKEMINFLQKLTNFSKSGNKLIMVLEKFGKIHPQRLVEWLNTNDFPFPEVILIYIHTDFKMDFFQLKPNRGTFLSKQFSKEEIMS